MATVRERLLSWSPAVFIGYNSFRFDEPFLQRAFWQSLFPPYLTVTRGNSRFDVLLLARAIQALKPDVLPWPRDNYGKATFRLDRLASNLGFNHTNAHDAEADVDATVYVAKYLAESFPEIWTAMLGRTTKAVFDAAFPLHEIALFAERGGDVPRIWFGQRIDRQNGKHAIFADLTADWALLSEGFGSVGGQEDLLQYVRKVIINRAAPIFTAAEAKNLFKLSTSAKQQLNAAFLQRWQGVAALAVLASKTHSEDPEEQRELEQMIYHGFASTADEAIMTDFHAAPLADRSVVAGSFEDGRFRALATRMIYVSGPEFLAPEEIERLRRGIRNRLFPHGEPSNYPWRSVAKARVELQELKKSAVYPPVKLNEIEDWLSAFD